jgi:hypothetical protein
MVIPNVSWGFLRYEADMLVITKSRFCTEIEVKVSMADWKQDQEKRKFTFSPDPRIKYQYYAAPRELALRHEELELPQGWGVIAVRDPMTPFLSPYSKAPVVDVLKEAEARDARKVTDKELMILARLACFRVWRRE